MSERWLRNISSLIYHLMKRNINSQLPDGGARIGLRFFNSFRLAEHIFTTGLWVQKYDLNPPDHICIICKSIKLELYYIQTLIFCCNFVTIVVHHLHLCYLWILIFVVSFTSFLSRHLITIAMFFHQLNCCCLRGTKNLGI